MKGGGRGNVRTLAEVSEVLLIAMATACMLFGIGTMLQAEQSRVRMWVGPRDFSFFLNAHTHFGAHPASYSIGTGAFFSPQGKRTGV